jgi:hypothetical protein
MTDLIGETRDVVNGDSDTDAAELLKQWAHAYPLAVEVQWTDGSWQKTDQPTLWAARGHKTRTIYAVESKR